MIVSPEFGERLDLKKHTRDLITRLSQDLNTDLEWVAVAHFNTGHPHVHVALRGVTPAGNLRLPRDVIKHTIRRHAEDLCTEQLGFRTVNDAIESERREINALHVTSLDREIQKRMTPTSEEVAALAIHPSGQRDLHAHHITARLHFLAKLDLALPLSEGRWEVLQEFQHTLRALQRRKDRQRSLAGKTRPSRIHEREA